MKIWGLFAGVAFTCLASACSSTSTSSPSDEPVTPGPTIVATEKGAVEGTKLARARSFLGIPYAAAPVGELRWKPPVDAAPWSGTRPARDVGHACPQIDTLSGKPTGDIVEDCLFLNVWTPLATPSRPAPIMVFIHGGGFVFGSGGERTFDGENLAAAGVVVVTFNYRLGVFGFLEHGALAAESGQAAAPSYGLLDQRAALQWVKKNAAAFGGDPSNVTIFGESAGALSVCSQLAMPRSRDLFQRAILQSSYCMSTAWNTPAAARKQGEDFAKALGCSDSACMRSKSASDVANALPVRRALFGTEGVLWAPTVDGVEIPRSPGEVLVTGAGTNVPVVLGTNRDEGNLATYAWRLTFGHEITEQEATGLMQLYFTEAQVKAIKVEYPVASQPSVPVWASKVMTDGAYVCPTRRIARAYAAAGAPVYLYQFAHPWNPPLFPNLGAAHSFELPFVFGTAQGGRDIGDEERPTSDAMVGYWSRFAATGDPNGEAAVKWPRYDGAGDAHIVLDTTIAAGSGLGRTVCDFWDKL